ncbi:MAG TPA: ribonuclease HII [Candidatus Paceibacterota bacterium]|nr:ribonuclease HII [Candidatus Paceibacterota bacterium]
MAVHEVIGVDEVGRGALAGPVVVAAAAVRPGSRFRGGPGKLKDSKKLSPARREDWYAYLSKHPGVRFAAARVYPRGIERLNISGAANLAALRAVRKLAPAAISRRNRGVFRVCLDGGLFLKGRKWQEERVPRAKTIVKADEKIAAVKIASIIAKVERDRFMCQLAKRHPGYGFEVHKGYGTSRHLDALAKLGPCAMHRLTFIPD